MIAGGRAVWPIIGQLALGLTAERLIVGAADPGDPALLGAYARRRWPAMAARVAGIDALNRAAQAEPQPLRDLRRLGLKAIHDLPPLRRLAMRLGLGAG